MSKTIQTTFKRCCHSQLSMEEATFKMIGAMTSLAKLSQEMPQSRESTSSKSTAGASIASLLHSVMELQGLYYRKLQVFVQHQVKFGEDCFWTEWLQADEDKERMLHGYVRRFIPHMSRCNFQREYLLYTMTQIIGYYDRKRRILAAIPPVHDPSTRPWMAELEEVWRSTIDDK